MSDGRQRQWPVWLSDALPSFFAVLAMGSRMPPEREFAESIAVASRLSRVSLRLGVNTLKFRILAKNRALKCLNGRRIACSN